MNVIGKNNNNTTNIPVQTKPKSRWLSYLGIGLLLGGLGSYLSSFSPQTLHNRVNVLTNTPDWNTTTPSYLNTLRLQRQVDSMNWMAPLFVTPPLPERSYPIKKEQAENWVNGHFGPVEQEAARSFIKTTRHVSHEEFERALSHSIGQFNDWLDQSEDKDYVLAVTSPEKSNHWVAQVGLKYFKTLPKQVVQIGYAGWGKLPGPFLSYMKDNPSVKTIVFMDDAAYGCSQSKWQLMELSKIEYYQECETHKGCTEERVHEIFKKVNYKIKAIIPFMRDPNCVLPSSKVQVSHFAPKIPTNDDHMQVFTTEKMSPLCELMPSKDIEVLDQVYKGRYLFHTPCEQIPIYFDHKIGDSTSTFNAIYSKGECESRPYVWNKENADIIREREAQSESLGNQFARWYWGPVDTRFIDPIKPPYKQEGWGSLFKNILG